MKTGDRTVLIRPPVSRDDGEASRDLARGPGAASVQRAVSQHAATEAEEVGQRDDEEAEGQRVHRGFTLEPKEHGSLLALRRRPRERANVGRKPWCVGASRGKGRGPAGIA